MRTAFLAMFGAIAAATTPFAGWCDSQQPAEQSRSGLADVNHDDPRWTAIERRAWAQITAGREVRLPGTCPDWQVTDQPPADEADLSTHTLSSRFVQQILTEPLSMAIPIDRPLVIRGARIVGDIELEIGVSSTPLLIDCSTIEGNIIFEEWEFLRRVEFSRVRVVESIQFFDVEARSRVTVRHSDVDSVKLMRSRIGQDLSFRHTRVRTELKIVSTSVGASLLMGCHVDSIDSRCAHYGRTHFLNVAALYGMDLIGSLFSDEVKFEEIDVGATLSARDVVYLKGLKMVGGVIRGRFEMPRAAVQGVMYLDGINVRGGINLHHGTYGGVSIIGAEVGRQLDIRASSLRLLDLSGTTVQGVLRIGSPDREVDWGSPDENARFIARNTHVETLQDTEGSWPFWLKRKLDGFEYEGFGGHDSDYEDSAYLRGAEWFKAWLAGAQTYSPQPYRHLSALLRREGQRDAASAVLYEAKERERTALPQGSWHRRWLGFLRLTVGYGVGLNAFFALFWMAGFGILGWFVACCATWKQSASRCTLFWYSVSYTVPGFSLSNHDEATLPCFGIWRSWFYMQRLFCYALALVAGAAAVGVVQP